jgi:predicted transposase/invertase (TIGR01784 family)
MLTIREEQATEYPVIHRLIKMAFETLVHVSEDDRERAINMSRRKWQTDYDSDMITAREVGREEGREEGRVEVARKLRAMGMSNEQIVQATGLSIEDIMA